MEDQLRDQEYATSASGYYSQYYSQDANSTEEVETEEVNDEIALDEEEANDEVVEE